MKAKKDIPKQKKIEEKEVKEERRNLLLYELSRITRELYPNQRIENPFEAETRAICNRLEITESLLLEDLLKSITLLNQTSRRSNQGGLISAEEDLLNALQLVLPNFQRLENRQLETLKTLKIKFGNHPFTYYEAGVILRISLSTLKRHFTPLIAHKLLERTTEYKGNKRLFKIAQSEILQQPQEPENYFLEAQGDWKDFIGFVEF